MLLPLEGFYGIFAVIGGGRCGLCVLVGHDGKGCVEATGEGRVCGKGRNFLWQRKSPVAEDVTGLGGMGGESS